jgi:hypothetical protein
MRRSQFYGALAATALALGVTATVAAPAQASTPTTISFDLSGHTHVKGTYGDYLGSLGGSVSYTQDDGTSADVYDGTAQLERLLPGQDWQVVAQDTDPGFLYFGNVGSRAKGNAEYRVHYLGGTYTDANNNPVALDPSYSGVVTVGTFRKLNDQGGSCGRHGCPLSGHIQPTYKHKKVLIQIKRPHHSWKKYKVVRTNKKSRFHASVARARKTVGYRIVVKGNKSFLRTTSGAYHISAF